MQSEGLRIPIELRLIASQFPHRFYFIFGHLGQVAPGAVPLVLRVASSCGIGNEEKFLWSLLETNQ